MILAGEIGATKTRLAAFENEGNRLNTVVEKTYLSQQESSLPNIASNFVKTEGIPVHSACFGVAGPVRGKTCKISNLAWTIDADELAGLLKLKSVGLINDLEAYAYGIDGLESKDFVTLSEGHEDAVGNRAVISARTGLGVAGLYWDGFRHHPFACEGGHCSFSPGNELEIELLQYLHKKHGRVSCERVLSGPGIKNIYEFLRDTGKEPEPDWLKEEMGKAPDGPALISRLALEKKAPICEKTLSIFVGVYGSQTGDCALTFMSTGGIFIGGSIAAKILPLMQASTFMQSFLAKGRMQGLLNDIPVKIVLNDNAGMVGAARYTLIQKAFKS
ncbi:MAG TPA: glucokinase [Terriglobales bacterium]|nr:glucokinase [Terriglobales bacterium]